MMVSATSGMREKRSMKDVIMDQTSKLSSEMNDQTSKLKAEVNRNNVEQEGDPQKMPKSMSQIL